MPFGRGSQVSVAPRLQRRHLACCNAHPTDPRPSAAAIWAPLARFIATEARIGDWAEPPQGDGFRLRVRALRHQAGLGLPVRRRDGGADRGHLSVVSARRGAQPLRFHVPRRARDTRSRCWRSSSRRWEEAKVILVYHVVGTIMEVFKTDVGSWIYPEASFFRIGGVPLFSGFMYAAVGSYIARCWRLFDFRFLHHPPLWAVYLLGLAIYVNFYYASLRRSTSAISCSRRRPCSSAARGSTTRSGTCIGACRCCSGFGLVSLFIWLAENLGTVTRTWLYPHQKLGWSAVSLGKLGLLVSAADHQLCCCGWAAIIGRSSLAGWRCARSGSNLR